MKSSKSNASLKVLASVLHVGNVGEPLTFADDILDASAKAAKRVAQIAANYCVARAMVSVYWIWS